MILYSLFISDPSFHFDGSSTRTLQGEGRRGVLGELDDEFYSEVLHLQLLVTLVNFVTIITTRSYTSRHPVTTTSADNVSVTVTNVCICLYLEAIDLSTIRDDHVKGLSTSVQRLDLFVFTFRGRGPLITRVYFFVITLR